MIRGFFDGLVFGVCVALMLLLAIGTLINLSERILRLEHAGHMPPCVVSGFMAQEGK